MVSYLLEGRAPETNVFARIVKCELNVNFRISWRALGFFLGNIPLSLGACGRVRGKQLSCIDPRL